MVDKVALQAELDKLYAVRTKLLCGESVEQVQFGAGGSSRRVQRTPADLPQVEARIRTIEGQLELNTARRRRPIGVAY